MSTPPLNALSVTGDWYDETRIDDRLTLVTEPHVKPLLSANTWVLSGDDADLFIDCGLGVASLRRHLPHLFERSPALIATHGHLDHVGSAHEFDEVWVHEQERVDRDGMGSLDPQRLTEILGAPQGAFGDELLIDALPVDDYDPAGYRLHPVTPTRGLVDGDRIALGDLTLTVLHLPGHTPGSISLYEPDRAWLFTGDVLYDEGGDMIDFFHDSSPRDYRASMCVLAGLEVSSVFAGHGPVFGGDRLQSLIERYLSLGNGADRENAYQ